MNNYQKIMYLCLGILFVFFSGFSRASDHKAEKKKTEAVPSISIPESKFIFPKVVEGKAILHTFVVKNTGTGILEIQKVKTG